MKNKTKRLLVLGDSLSLPRSEPEKCNFEDTWPQRLRNKGYEVIQCSIGGGTSRDLSKQADHYEDVPVDACVVQVGIVDCTPRFAKKSEIKLIRMMGERASNKILSMLNNNYVKRLRNLTYVEKEEFKNNIKNISKKFKNVIFIPIVADEKKMEHQAPGFIEKRNNYNDILYRYSKKEITFENDLRTYVMSDFHHIISEGQKRIANKVDHKVCHIS